MIEATPKIKASVSLTEVVGAKESALACTLLTMLANFTVITIAVFIFALLFSIPITLTFTL